MTNIQQKPTKRTTLSLQLFVALVTFCSILAVNAAQRAAQTFDGVAMRSSDMPPLPSDFTATASVIGEPQPLLTAPSPHVVTLEWHQSGNVLLHVVEESGSPLGPWEVVAVRWNDFIQADTTFAVSFTSNRNPAFWRVGASNTR